jgi:hypothetical protein
MPFYWFGYVITDNRLSTGGKGFFSPLPRFVCAMRKRYASVYGDWDYWSYREEMNYRTEAKAVQKWRESL